MSRLFVVLGLLMWPMMSSATDGVAMTPVERWQADHSVVFSADEVHIEDFRWIARPVIVFGDSEYDPRFVQQMALIEALPEELAERDVVIITDTDPAAKSEARTEYRPRSFMMVLVGKDGSVYLRKPFPWDVRELSRSIDKLPLRQQEVRDRRGE
ncbi:DUF4174 domain-containing protein [Actibacterium pelagium]|uniref:DUF4174 domain-containing protein n=1 Tax=Actibacterium pelagium TaxID=2029103 RepID=A0A917AGR9_9RHOB|nr:DUF4174 domain-containing protein [Actibacterium pelagium]GGE49370.1 hypothetical protein GCM10011517_16460 [Actibacterium pelagium]